MTDIFVGGIPGLKGFSLAQVCETIIDDINPKIEVQR